MIPGYKIAILIMCLIVIIISYVFHHTHSDIKNQKDFYLACQSGNANAIEALINKGVDVDEVYEVGDEIKFKVTPLLLVMEGKSARAVNLIMKNSKNTINTKDSFGKTPLITALEFGKTEFAKMLIDAGADVNEKDINGTTPLIAACETYQGSNIVRELVEHNANINAKDVANRTPLYCSIMNFCHNNILEVINILIEYNADLNTIDKSGGTPLDCAFFYFNNKNISGKDIETLEEIIALLKKHGAKTSAELMER
jgi:ankyrin repeat protein